MTTLTPLDVVARGIVPIAVVAAAAEEATVNKVSTITKNANTDNSNESKNSDDAKTAMVSDNSNGSSSSINGSSRCVGRWYLGETLGKGGYSWVKKGRDKNTGRVVALKFMDHKKTTAQGWNKQQLMQVKTEIECLRQIKHNNVMKLMAYNFNAKYPNKDGTDRPVILLVLEYMPGGELFDILYYTNSLEEIIGRTYFRQLVLGIEACHSLDVIHRDIKPQNLLLDSKFNLKITDFGLAKFVDGGSINEKGTNKKSNSNNSNANANSKIALMNTFHVGTRGYQAPEILGKDPYTGACDVFSIGVVMFVLLAGYPPFEHAKDDDRWYQHIARSEYRKFWKAHRGCGVQPQAIDLITRMLTCDASKRITLQRIKKHPWYNGEVLSGSNLTKVLRLKHQEMEIKRIKDPSNEDLGVSNPREMLLPKTVMLVDKILDSKQEAPLLPSEEGIGLRDVFSNMYGYLIFKKMQQVVNELMGGTCCIDEERFSMQVHVTAQSVDVDEVRNGTIHFAVNIYYSREYGLNIVKFKRLKGTMNFWNTVLTRFIGLSSAVLTGLPASLGDECDEEGQKLLEKAFPQENKKKMRNRVRQEKFMKQTSKTTTQQPQQQQQA